jgi:hypothetical protein
VPDDDPFADLGGEPRKKSRAEEIGDRLAERDRIDPEEPPRPPQPTRRPGSKYAWAVGILLFMGIIALYFTTAQPNKGEGVRGPATGTTLSAFAAPLASGALSGDANVCQRTPCPEEAGKVLACDVRSDQVLNSCKLREGPAVLTFVVTQGTDCEPQVDRVERMRRQFPDVQFAVVLSGLDRDEAVQIVRRRRWKLPVGLDPDGAVTNLYGIGVCPTTVFSDKNGKVRETSLGNVTEEQLRARVRRISQ